MKLQLGCLVVGFVLLPAVATGSTLQVGPAKEFRQPSQAIAAAHAGDVVEIDSSGTYDGDVAQIRVENLTLRGVGRGPARLDAQGNSAARGKGIWVQDGANLTVENIEFRGARSPDHNGAGIRAEAPGLIVRHCNFVDCENGILGGIGEVVIEHCEFRECGLRTQPVTHSCYIGTSCTRLLFRFNYSTATLEGHLLKSRAQQSWVLYNRLTDEEGTGSAVADFPNGGLVVLVGNVLHKGSKGHNDRVIAYGMEGLKHTRNELYVVNNTMLYEHRHTQNWFVRVERAPADMTVVLRNNLCLGAIPLTNFPQADAGGNLLFRSPAFAHCVDVGHYDFHLQADSPCVNQGVAPGQVGDMSLVPEFQYVHPCGKEARPEDGTLDVGAYELAPRSPRK